MRLGTRVPRSVDAWEWMGRTVTTLRSSICLLVVGACLSGGALHAQETRTENGRHGGFGGPAVKLTQIDSELGVLAGGRGGWILDGSWVIGGGGYVLVNGGNFDHVTNAQGDPGELEMAYGGLELGYVHCPDESVHVALGLLIGSGGVTWNRNGQSGNGTDDGFFVAEPELDVVLNVTRSFRAALGVSYRLTQGVELFDLGDAELSGLAGIVTLKFGSF